jgi:hypothetical protein
MLRAKAELERDPEIRAEWKYIARGYLIWLINLSGMAARTLVTLPFHEFAPTKK